MSWSPCGASCAHSWISDQPPPPFPGVLVREDLLHEAWAAAMANPGQVPESQWFQLIEVREKDHPADVIRPYQDLIEIGLDRAATSTATPRRSRPSDACGIPTTAPATRPVSAPTLPT